MMIPGAHVLYGFGACLKYQEMARSESNIWRRLVYYLNGRFMYLDADKTCPEALL